MKIKHLPSDFTDHIAYIDNFPTRVVCTCGARLKVLHDEDADSIIIRVLPHFCLKTEES